MSDQHYRIDSARDAARTRLIRGLRGGYCTVFEQTGSIHRVMEHTRDKSALRPTPVDLRVLASRREAILSAARRRGAFNVRVFGSVARGEATSGSDVDFLVDLEPGRSLLDLGGLLMDLEEVVGSPVDVVTEKGLRPRLRQRVLSEAITL